MSEDTDDQAAPPEDTKPELQNNYQKAIELIHQRAKATCPMCANEKWRALPSPRLDDERWADGVALPIVRTGRYPIRGFYETRTLSLSPTVVGSIPVAAFVCTSCGFVRQHVLFPESLQIGKSDDNNYVTVFRYNTSEEDAKAEAEQEARERERGNGP